MIAAEDLRTRRPRRCLRVTPTRGKTRALGGGFLSSCAPTLLSRACPQRGQHADEKAQYPALLTALSFRERHLLLQLLVSCSVVLFARHSSHLLYVVVGESAAVLQLLGGEHQALLAGRDPCQNVEQKKKNGTKKKSNNGPEEF